MKPSHCKQIMSNVIKLDYDKLSQEITRCSKKVRV